MVKFSFKHLIATILILIGLELAIYPIRDILLSIMPIVPAWIIGIICVAIAVYMIGVDL